MIRLALGCLVASWVIGTLIAAPNYHPMNIAACACACLPAVAMAVITILREG